MLPQSLPFFYGDTIVLNVYLYQLVQAATNPAGNFPYQIIPNMGLQLELFIDDGTIAGTLAPLAGCVNWAPDPTNSYLTGTLSLNTEALAIKIGTGISLSCYLSVGYIANGQTTTVLKVPINIGVGVLNGPFTVPPTLTPLSLEAARNMFFPIQPVKGQVLYLATLTGRVFMAAAVDDAAGGHVDISPTGQVIP